MAYENITTLEEAKSIISAQDRMIGEFVREIDFLKDSQSRRNSWLSEAKRRCGFSDTTSFDEVWEYVLKKAKMK